MSLPKQKGNKDLSEISRKIRLTALELYYNARAGHIGSSMSCTDILTALFFSVKTSDDKIILSKGHAAAALYSTLYHCGEISWQELDTFYHDGTKLPAHPAPLSFPSIPVATGSLGHGLPVGCGIALSKKLKAEAGKVFVIISDGETNEGSTWEAMHFAVRHQLNNLIVIIDNNGLQGFDSHNKALGNTSNPVFWKEAGWEYASCNGHDPNEIVAQISSNTNTERPFLLSAQTVKGKGISYMENKLEWHYWPMNEEQYQHAVREISMNNQS
ncbi:MAG: transketolase [Bacteroidetes bacterium]|nr:transketolase [Bacteroidota bacterium]MBU1720180.1 transketolase [Bacteroidota bacterium]